MHQSELQKFEYD
jgi:hypothetical protein